MIYYPNIINKNIIYSDTVLPLKEVGNNLKLTSISDVSKSSLEDCINIITDSNPDVEFNTIQYSEKDEKIYFYTNKPISTNNWGKNNFLGYKYLTNIDEILIEIEKTLLKKNPKSTNCISLYKLSCLINKYYSEWERMIKICAENCGEILKSKYPYSSFLIYDINYKKNQIKVGFTSSSDLHRDYKHIIFERKNNDLYIVKSEELFKSEEILSLIGTKLSCLYDKCYTLSQIYVEDKSLVFGSLSFIQPINSKFKVIISYDDICLCSFAEEFSISASNTLKNIFYLKCNSSIILSKIKDKEINIFNNTLISIDDCPKWCKEIISYSKQEKKKLFKTILSNIIKSMFKFFCIVLVVTTFIFAIIFFFILFLYFLYLFYSL